MSSLSLLDSLLSRRRFAGRLSPSMCSDLTRSRVDAVDAAIRRFRAEPSASGRLVSLSTMETALLPSLSNEAFFHVELEPSPGADQVIKAVIEGLVRSARRRELLWRIVSEASHAISKGFYPIFWTLTVEGRDWSDAQIAAKLDGAVWRAFRENLRNRTIVAAYGSRAAFAASGDGIEDVFCCVSIPERGPRGRLHLHALTFHKALPADWLVDPNARTRRAYRQEIDAAKPLWRHGFSSPRAFRYGDGDCWAKHGWREFVRKDGSPLHVGTAEAMARYLAKYMTECEGDDLAGLRCKMSRGFGLRPIVEVCRRLPSSMLRKLDRPWRKIDPGCTPKGAPPARLLKLVARRERLCRIAGRREFLALIRCRDFERRCEASPSLLDRLRAIVDASGDTELSASALMAALRVQLLPVHEDFYCILEEIAAFYSPDVVP